MRLRWVVPPLAAAAALALSGCDLRVSSTEDDQTEPVAITEIRISGGGGGDITVAPGPAGQAQIHRKFKYWGDEVPSRDTYRIEGSTLYLDTGCGRRCDVSYDVRVPEGAKVSGENGSGNMELSGMSTVDIRVSSGDIRLSDIRAQVTARASSGNIRGTGIRATTIDLEAKSGNVSMDLVAPANVTANVSSGNISLRVPAGASYRVDATTSSGDRKVSVPTELDSTHHLDLHASSGDITVSTG